MAGILVSSMILYTSSWVSARVDPPAPYVTLTNEGSQTESSLMTLNKACDASSVFGGKNSKETVDWRDFSISEICIEKRTASGYALDEFGPAKILNLSKQLSGLAGVLSDIQHRIF